MGLEGKEDSVEHSVSQSSRAVGGLDAIPGGGKDHSCHAKCEGNRAGNPQGWEVGGNSQHEAAPKLV